MLQKRAEEATAPAMVFQEADLSVRVVRDIFSKQFERAIVDDPKQHHRLESFFTRTAPELLERLELYKDDKQPLFERYGIEEAIQSTLQRRVDLPSGGYLMIDYAEAMTVIDINSGSFTGRGKGARLEDTITKTNLEAADEVRAPAAAARHRRHHRHRLHRHVAARATATRCSRRCARRSTRTARRPTWSRSRRSGLVEMTRQNVTDGVREILTKTCPTCEGEGVVLSEETVAIDAERKLRELAAERPGTEAFLIQLHPRVAALLAGGPGRPLLEIEEETGKHFHFEGSEALPIDHFAVSLEGSQRGGRGARAALPRGRGGARDHRGAAHVRRGRRRRQARRLRDLGGGRRRAAGQEDAGADRGGRPLGRLGRRWWRAPRWCRRGGQRGRHASAAHHATPPATAPPAAAAAKGPRGGRGRRGGAGSGA